MTGAINLTAATAAADPSSDDEFIVLSRRRQNSLCLICFCRARVTCLEKVRLSLSLSLSLSLLPSPDAFSFSLSSFPFFPPPFLPSFHLSRSWFVWDDDNAHANNMFMSVANILARAQFSAQLFTQVLSCSKFLLNVAATRFSRVASGSLAPSLREIGPIFF